MYRKVKAQKQLKIKIIRMQKNKAFANKILFCC